MSGATSGHRQSKLPGRVCDAFLKGLAAARPAGGPGPSALRYRPPAGGNQRLRRRAGSRAHLAPALFDLLSNRKFPAATFLRRREDFDYLQEPDVFHEIFGHCPMLTDQTYADFLERFGVLALSLDRKYLWQLQRLFWFTVEFGLIDTPEGLRIYGAGIASSAGETPYALESDLPERRPWTP